MCSHSALEQTFYVSGEMLRLNLPLFSCKLLLESGIYIFFIVPIRNRFVQGRNSQH